MNILPDDIDFENYEGLIESMYVRPVSDFVVELKARVKDGYQIRGEKLPWHKTHELFRFRRGEVTLLAGLNGTKKSMLLGQVVLWLPCAIKSVIASLEMSPVDTLERMLYQALGANNPTEQFVDAFTKLTNNIWLYDQQDTVSPDRMLGMIAYMAKEHGVEFFVVDSLVKCGIAPDNYPAQKDFADKLTALAKHYQSHIVLVHHRRKGHSVKERSDRFSVKGAGELTDLAHNVMLLERNFEKEEKIENGEEPGKMEPDIVLRVDKQRNGRWEGDIALWFRGDGLQFVSGPDAGKLPWRIETRYPEAQSA